MKIKEALTGISETIGGFILWILFIAAIFGVIYVIRIPFAVVAFPALEALPEAERIAQEKYPDAGLTSVTAHKYEIIQIDSPDKIETRQTGTVAKPLRDDGTAQEWYFGFYSSSKKSSLGIYVVKKKLSKEIKGKISVQREEKDKERQELGGAIFDLLDWKIDSTKAVEIAKSELGDFSPGKLTLRKQSDGILIWDAESAKLKKFATGGDMWGWETIAEINANSGKIIRGE
ncbi:hypothetical protein COY23_03575 [bacterium (Candidatus Torokbacteria) CG_4_10_14_0_2_um_filter_35_8]|nr:MAG: hypothetical protein COY23_03575 [bacterium (Candidatus Torokbacteria) CG_4_10_14_0_2_um_filter_35_8]